MTTISLCMIVYNEENDIRRCLESACGLADEIIIVDTGSTDRTKLICIEYGAKIFEYKWADNFSDARNYSISKASCDWILLLDADEELIICNSEGLKQYLSDTGYNLIPVGMTHFYGNEPADKTRAHFSGAPRLFRREENLRFTGKIHEKIDDGEKSVGQAAETRHFIKILHYGYMEGRVKSKTARNISLLLKERGEQPDDPWLNYHLAVEYYITGKFAAAYLEINTAIAGFIKKGLMPPSLTYKLKYDMLVVFHQYDTAYNAIEKAIALYPDYVDLHFYKGILQYVRGEYDKGLITFSYCLILGLTNMNYLILAGSGSYLALYYLGLCHEKRGESEQGAEAFRQAQALCPGLGSSTQPNKYIELFNAGD